MEDELLGATGKISGVGGGPLTASMDFAAKRSVLPLRYSYKDLDGERRSTDRVEV